jgi:hypothetical protein
VCRYIRIADIGVGVGVEGYFVYEVVGMIDFDNFADHIELIDAIDIPPGSLYALE